MLGAMNRQDLLAELRDRCGVRAGDVLIVHSSMKSIGWIEGGAAAAVEALRSAVGEAGTVLMPAFCAPPDNGVIEIAHTPSRVGAISECFRTRPGVLRSRHPTHSVCAGGRRAAEFIAGHEHTSGLGVDSPLHKAARAGADVLMIGCGLTSCSLVHIAEAIARVPYLGRVTYARYHRTLTLVDADGRRRSFPPVDVPGDSEGFTVVQDALLRRRRVTECGLGAARVLKMRGMDILHTSRALLRRDPAALLCRDPACEVCPSARRIVAHQ
jgi:aminoglycoside 3-N-acetyltransferase